jgi:pyridoxal phosphate-dependent aminotransferase EpsN
MTDDRIYLSAPDVRGQEEEYVVRAMRSNWVAPVGPDLDAFEDEVAAVCSVEHAVGLSSGTAALHLAMIFAGVGQGDEVLVPTLTFVPTANAVRYVGGTPVFIDSEAESWGISPVLLKEELQRRAKVGRLPKAVVSVDLYGQCADYDEILPILGDYEIPLIEDAAEALGASRSGRPAGSFGVMAALSFNGNKIITASGGGMLLTDDGKVFEHARKLATQAREPVPYYEHVEIGFNYRMSNLLAAFGRAQLEDLPKKVERRKEIYQAYAELFTGIEGYSMMPVPVESLPNWWLSCVLVDPMVAGTTSEAIRLELEEHDIESRPLWKPMHLQPLYQACQRIVDGTSELLFRTGLCLPSGSGMSDGDLDRVLHHLELILHRADG